MDSDYDRKFEEMKKYIPFLESMIKRLETTSPPSANPRQAQLDKIRSLRDLLQDKKKRMKMENLLKCEQVLINLYAKVEQRDTLPGIKKASEPLFPLKSSKEKEKSDLNTARTKLKSVVTKKPQIVQEDDPDTLPEIAGPSETEVVCVPGSKEPALFQRRPNKASKSPSKVSLVENIDKKSPQKTVPKRNYTRVLVSPEPSNRRWSTTEDPPNKPLFSRRSPRKSPRRHSPSHKKEKKKSSKQTKIKTKDLNITLNVPEESLSSLNTGDILSRIIKCPDNDVDIDTLRDLRAQILGELKQTGANDDISDLILRSYKSKKKSKKTKEIEEGELSDSESEAIQSIYGSLVVVDKDKNSSVETNTKLKDTEKEPRKIQICLVINSDKEGSAGQGNTKATDEIDFEMFDVSSKNNVNIDDSGDSNEQRESANQNLSKFLKKNMTISENRQLLTIDVEEDEEAKNNNSKNDVADSDSSYIDISSSDNECTSIQQVDKETNPKAPFPANFYKPLNDQDEQIKAVSSEVPKTTLNAIQKTSSATIIEKTVSVQASAVEMSESVSIAENLLQGEADKSIQNSDKQKVSQRTDIEKPSPVAPEELLETQSVTKDDVKDCDEIPLLNTEPMVPVPTKKPTVSEIDILQALKNEILSESIAIPGADVGTPLLHQPKVTKVASGQEVMKKRISIEKYKEKKLVPTRKPSLFLNEPFSNSKESIKKTSLKLTEEEQQRFKNILPLSLGDSSDEDNNVSSYSVEDIYCDLAPRSPEHKDKTTSSAPPIIIPVDPVKPTVATSNSDVDMRTLRPILSPNAPKPVPPPNIMPASMIKNNVNENGPQKHMESKRLPLVDPRMRRDLNNPISRNSPNSPNSHSVNSDRTPRASGNLSNMTPNARSLEMTPSHHPFDMDDGSNRSHVYAPFPTLDSRENTVNSDNKDLRWEANSDRSVGERRLRWDPWKDSDMGENNKSRNYDDRDYRRHSEHDSGPDYHRSRYESDRYEKRDEYSHNRIDCPRTPVHPFGRSDCSTNSSFSRVETAVNPYGRKDGPSTPIHPLGRSDCPTTPSHPFGRSDSTSNPIHGFGMTDHPMTPTHSFGRSDRPMTPVHPFGRTDVPMTPNHQFGRSDAPMTPSHPFGRSDVPMTPTHSFGRSEAPMTPSHPFGRTDLGNSPMTPSHSFGRSDHSQNTGLKVKDPRLNRTNEYESNLRRYENEQRGYYKDRRSDGSNRSYNQCSDSYRNHREQSIGRSDGGGHHFRERTPGREPSVGRGISRDFEKDRPYLDHGRRQTSYDYRRDIDHTSNSYQEVGTRRDYHQRAQSVGRSGPFEDRNRLATSRPPHDETNKASTINTLSVKPQTGRSFTIDTSVNSTFQEFLNVKGLPVFKSSFEDRRRRATSVGRTLTRVDRRDSSIGRNYREGSVGLSQTPRRVQEDTSGYKTMVNFVRAQSMGRELVDRRSEKSFKEVKADLVSFRDSCKKPTERNKNFTKQNNLDPRSRRNQFKRTTDKKSSPQKNTNYSPRKNYRDPRMNRENNERNKQYDDKKKTYGIVYSNDNIARGTILGSGFGVKNYKIPKIKRPIEEPKEETKIEEKIDKNAEKNNYKIKNKETSTEMTTKVQTKSKTTNKKAVHETKIKQAEISGRPSRSGKTDKVSGGNTSKTRKVKKAIIDSDSDSETITTMNLEDSNIGVKKDSKNDRNATKSSVIVREENTMETKEDSIFDSSLGMDDLDVFPENIASDPVLSNINELIADLDKEIGTSKEDDSNKDDAFDTLLEDIDSPEAVDESLNDITEVIKKDFTPFESNQHEPNKELIEAKKVEPTDRKFQETLNTASVDESLKDISEVIKKDVTPVDSNQHDTTKKLIDAGIVEPTDNKFQLTENIVYNDNLSCAHESNQTINKAPEPNSEVEKTVKSNSEAIVSTTELEKEPSMLQDIAETESPKKTLEVIEDRSSTPDSTINTSEFQSKSHDEEMPDSTNEKSDTNPDVSSSLDQAETSKKNDEKRFHKDNTSESIGNLLSILQDKSKIKELLNMLGDQTEENEIIKKKLEKISSIVSDDEYYNNDQAKTKRNEKVEEPLQIEKMLQTPTNNVDSEDKEALSTPKDDAKEDLVESVKTCGSNQIDKKEAVTKDKPRKGILKKTKKRKKKGVKSIPKNAKRLTRSTANLKAKQRPRELRLLEESIKEMGSDMSDMLNDTGIRSCRLAKMLDDKQEKEITATTSEPKLHIPDPKPVVVLQKFRDNDKDISKEEKSEIKIRKKPGPKPKVKPPLPEGNEVSITKVKETKTIAIPKYKPGPKSKRKVTQEDSDPYSFEDSVSEATTTQMSEQDNDSGSESESITSSKSFGSSDVLSDLKKKPKRKRRNKWNSGIISSRKRKKTELKPAETIESSTEDTSPVLQKHTAIPDMNCFTDKSYCFLKNVQAYPCRLCHYTGSDIVKHYKTEHPHAEIPLSRMHALLAREAIEQCEDINFQTVSKMPTEKYVCRFCYEEFGRKKTNLEEFFWHVVSTHTGEYKQLCSECVNVTRCPFNLDIPPPPKDLQGQLIGYICGKCHFTQISLENLKMHVIVRHNDEQTAVYTINLAVMSKKTMNALMKHAAHNEETRVLRSSRSNTSFNDQSDSEQSDFTENTDVKSDESLKRPQVAEKALPNLSVQSKLSFESDDTSNADVKVENQDQEDQEKNSEKNSDFEHDQPSSDILDYPHFKIFFGESGAKEYVCCINGKDNHYKTNLIISMKRHVQTKHPEVWDGYCSVCKVIVMPQGQHNFKECLQHMLDSHIDNFPVLDQLNTESQHNISHTNSEVSSETGKGCLTYINVRPLSDLMTANTSDETVVALPKIESVVSLGTASVEPQRLSPAGIAEPAATLYKSSTAIEKIGPKPEEPYKYEEWQAEVMAKKHLVILDAMLSEEKLVKIYKCAGRYCSFTTDSADLAVLHASTHQRVGGENALICSYCDFDCKGNAIDLVMHVFKTHGRCKYLCGQCFYRAVASQLVLAHSHRVHGSSKKILETATATSAEDDLKDVLPREIAVQYYVCADVGNVCKFRTYTQGKFIEHLQKHGSPYMCSICVSPSEHPTELLQHLKTHGLKLYQCTWCLSGADNEAEFLAHSSARHPTRQPQAYLRIITNNQKGGVTKTMVLPLVKLNKSSVATQTVAVSGKVDDPVREAERALDLEKIITSTSLFGENNSATATLQSLPSPKMSKQPLQMSNVESDTSLMAEVIPITRPRPQTPPPSTSSTFDQDASIMLTPMLKTEPADDTPQKDTSASNIICLDSDDDESPDPLPAQAPVEPPTPEKQNVIDVSDDECALEDTSVLNYKKVDLSILYKCKQCEMVFSVQGFKRHLQRCFANVREYGCAHCSFTTSKITNFFNHYQMDHGQTRRRHLKYQCDVCKRVDKSLTVLKAHMKKDHNISNCSMAANNLGENETYCIVSESTKRVLPKRKLSGGPAPESILKRVRYGPQDLSKLPQKPILDELTYCSECEFSTKVRVNLVRHIQFHADNQSVPQTAPVNPVPHLETNEKHFDKMVNLASSSFELGRHEKATPTVTLHIPPEAASRYPKYVPDRQRHTCGAKGCSYISVDEAMLKCHWETLHSGSNDFHCVHCPPYQYLDTSKPLTSARIIAHLKMHDVRLYACSSCAYYHYRKQVLEKHLTEKHKGAGQVMIVREESTGLPLVGTPQPGASTAPTMDLKAWKCGLCAYKSMLRPEVVDHCAKTHNTKMQFKCPLCPFRASTIENVKKHQSNSHPGNTEDVLYYYYREGSIPDEPDGTPRWVKQRQKIGNLDVQIQQHFGSEVKTETLDAPGVQQLTLQDLLTKPQQLSMQSLLNAPAVPSTVNLEIVKKENSEDENMEFLCSLFGDICDPNGLKYKCPMCTLGMEDTRDAMQSHLFEELQYRKWGCSICSYKAFHKTGLNEHMITEHRHNRAIEPKELPIDTKVEKWVNNVLDHQSSIIEANKANLTMQKLQIERPNPTPSAKPPEKLDITKNITANLSKDELENLRRAFGDFGKASGTKFCCPKCDYQISDEGSMKDHLENELNIIRWRCSVCWKNSQNFHEAQLHSKTCKRPGQVSRPVEAVRDPNIRASWVVSVLDTQKQAMKDSPKPLVEETPTGPVENSLLVVRYEEKVPTPEEEMINKRKRPAPVPATTSSPDSDDERLVIDDKDNSETPKKKETIRNCPYCTYATKYQQALDYHILRHYKLKAITCMNCNLTFQNKTATLTQHHKQAHPDLPLVFEKTQVPSGPPLAYDILQYPKRKRNSSSCDEPFAPHESKPTKSKEDIKKDDGPKLVCLTCEKAMPENETSNHNHGSPTFFAKKGEVIVKCCVCLLLFPNVNDLQQHNLQSHPNTPINYAYFKLLYDTREIYQCEHCNKRFKFFRDLKVHHSTFHVSLQLKYESKPYFPGAYDVANEDCGERSKHANNVTVLGNTAEKRIARKSTTKLPSQTVAKKSTAKLPFHGEESDFDEEFSYYGTKPAPMERFENVTTPMPFYNDTTRTVPIKKFCEIVKISPKVVVEDCKK